MFFVFPVFPFLALLIDIQKVTSLKRNYFCVSRKPKNANILICFII